MAISSDQPITWGELVAQTKANLKNNIENLSGAQIPQELVGSEFELSTANGKSRESGVFTVRSKAKTSDRIWGTVNWTDVEEDFNLFLNYHHINSRDRENQVVSTRLIMNFLENVALFYTNRLIIVYAPFGSFPKKLYYYNNGSTYDSWQGKVTDIESPVEEVPVTAEELRTALSSLDTNLKNKVKTYTQKFTYESTCCSCSSSCSSCSSSSSSCCSCLTIVHQDLSML